MLERTLPLCVALILYVGFTESAPFGNFFHYYYLRRIPLKHFVRTPLKPGVRNDLQNLGYKVGASDYRQSEADEKKSLDPALFQIGLGKRTLGNHGPGMYWSNVNEIGNPEMWRLADENLEPRDKPITYQKRRNPLFDSYIFSRPNKYNLRTESDDVNTDSFLY